MVELLSVWHTFEALNCLSVCEDMGSKSWELAKQIVVVMHFQAKGIDSDGLLHCPYIITSVALGSFVYESKFCRRYYN